jgi:hypothetical protein
MSLVDQLRINSINSKPTKIDEIYNKMTAELKSIIGTTYQSYEYKFHNIGSYYDEDDLGAACDRLRKDGFRVMYELIDGISNVQSIVVSWKP